MDISDDDFYLDSKQKNENITNTSDLTKVFARTNNSSLTSSSSSSSDEEDEIKKSLTPKQEDLFDNLKMDIDKSNKDSQHFEIDKSSTLDVHSKVTNENSSIKSFDEKFFINSGTDSPLNNVEWTDFSNVSTENSKTNPSNNKPDVLPLSDPWTTNQKEIDAVAETLGNPSENDNWANFD